LKDNTPFVGTSVESEFTEAYAREVIEQSRQHGIGISICREFLQLERLKILVEDAVP
jgi:hypothetical protein